MLKDTKSATNAQAAERAPLRRYGYIGGYAQLQVPMPGQQINLERGGEDISVVFGRYVQGHVKALMDQFGSIPSKITLEFHPEEE